MQRQKQKNYYYQRINGMKYYRVFVYSYYDDGIVKRFETEYSDSIINKGRFGSLALIQLTTEELLFIKLVYPDAKIREVDGTAKVELDDPSITHYEKIKYFRRQYETV